MITFELARAHQKFATITWYGYISPDIVEARLLPSTGTILNFVLFSAASILTIIAKKSKIAAVLGSFILFSGITGLIGYITNIPSLYSYTPHLSSGMSIYTVTCFIALGLCTYLTNATYGLRDM